MDRSGDRVGSVGFQKVAFLPVYLSQGSALGQRHLPQRGQCNQCGAEEKGVCESTVL